MFLGRLSIWTSPISLTLFVCLFQISSLLQSKQIHQCEGVVTATLFHFHFMCDSAWYLLSTQDLSRILQYSEDPSVGGSLVQSRPFFILLAYFFHRVYKLFGLGNISFVYSGEDGVPIEYFISAYLAYLTINIFTVFIIIYLFKGIIVRSGASPKQILFGLQTFSIMLASSATLSLYFWLPNPAISNLLVPILSLFILGELNKIRSSYWKVALFFLLSFLPLYYPNFLFTTVAVLIYLLIKKRFFSTSFYLFSLAPFFLWSRVVVALGGTYKDNAREQYSSFTWIIEDFRKGIFVNSLFTHLEQLLITFITPLLFCLIVITGYLLRNSTLSLTKKGEDTSKLLILGYSLWLIGLGRADVRWSESLLLFIVILLIITLSLSEKLSKSFIRSILFVPILAFGFVISNFYSVV